MGPSSPAVERRTRLCASGVVPRRSRTGATSSPCLRLGFGAAKQRHMAQETHHSDRLSEAGRRSAEIPGARTRRPRLLGHRRHVPRQHRASRRRTGIRVLRRPAVRQRPAALRASADRLRQGHRAAVPHHARLQGGAPLRLGHPRPARRTRGAAPARHHRQGADRRDGHREVQRRLPGVGAQVHQRMARLRHPPGPLGRLRQRLQDARSDLHGVGDLGVQAAVGQGPCLRGQSGAAVLLERRNAAVQPRTADGRRRLPESPGPGDHRRLPGQRGR